MSEAAVTKKESETKRVRALVDRAQKGDRAALEELYLIHFDRIYSYLHVSVGNRHDAEDLTTQTFLKMLEKIGSFRWQSAPFSAWLFRIAHNLAMDHFRSRRRWQPEEEVPEPPAYEGVTGMASSTASGAGRRRRRRIRATAAAHTAASRAALVSSQISGVPERRPFTSPPRGVRVRARP